MGALVVISREKLNVFGVFLCALALTACAAGGDSQTSGRTIGSDGTGLPGGAVGDPGLGGAGEGGLPGDPSGMPGDFGNSGDDGALTPIEKMIMEGEECASFEQQAKNEKQPVDIIWAIDSSPSMATVIDLMEAEMNNLVTTVTAADIDVHIILISAKWKESPIFNNQPVIGDPVVCIEPPVGSGDCNNDNNPPVYNHITECPGGAGALGCAVSSHSALNKLISAYPAYKSALRQNSLKYFGAVTDDSAGDTMDFAGQASQFTADVAALDPGWFDDWKFFGIINPTLGGAYQMLADQTGGVTGELSFIPQDYTALFNELAKTVTDEVKLDCEWEIPATPPEAGMFDQYKVNFSYVPGDGSVPPAVLHVDGSADCGMDQGWYYDNNDAPGKVVVCPKTCATIQPDLMGKIDILFGCSTLERPD